MRSVHSWPRARAGQRHPGRSHPPPVQLQLPGAPGGGAAVMWVSMMPVAAGQCVDMTCHWRRWQLRRTIFCRTACNGKLSLGYAFFWPVVYASGCVVNELSCSTNSCSADISVQVAASRFKSPHPELLPMVQPPGCHRVAPPPQSCSQALCTSSVPPDQCPQIFPTLLWIAKV